MYGDEVRISRELVDAVRGAIDIVALASEQTRLTKAGQRFKGVCPFHKEKTPSFSVDPVQGLYYCFGCGAGGDAIKFHMTVSGDDFRGAIVSLAERYHIPLPRRDGERQGPDPSLVLEAAAKFFSEQLQRFEMPRRYLEKRLIPAALVETYGLGYAPDDWQSLVGALGRQFPIEALEGAGLLARSEKNPDRPYDRFRNRLMFPIRSATGRLLGFGGRTLGEDRAKYVNTAETEQFHKGNILYGLDQAKRGMREGGRAILVEGYFDVLGAVASELDGVVAGMGTALTPEQARILARYVDEVIVAYDGDDAGENAYRRTLPLLLERGLMVRRARFGAGHDPDSLRVEAGEEAVRKAVELARDGVDEEIERLTPPGVDRDPRQQSSSAGRLADLLRPIPDEVLRFGFARQAAQRLSIPEGLLLERIRGRRSEGPTARVAAPVAAQKEVPRMSDLEASVVASLFDLDTPIPPLDEFPPEDLFFDASCRNIFRVFCDLYRRGEERPDVRTLAQALDPNDPDDASSLNRLAQLSVGANSAMGTNASTGLSLRESLDKLLRRWQKTRLRELAREIEDAQRQSDEARLLELHEEKLRLSLGLQGRPV